MNPNPSSQNGAIVDEILGALSRHRLAVVIALVVTVVSGYAGLQFVSEQYDSTARLLVKLGRENTEVPLTVEKGGVISSGVRKEEINSEVQLLHSRDLIEMTVDQLGLDAFEDHAPVPQAFLARVKYEAKRLARWVRDGVQDALVAMNLKKGLSKRDKAIVLVERSLVVEREKDSDVISARLRLTNPDLAVRFLDALVKNFFERHVEIRSDSSVGKFYAAQVEDYRRRLDEIGQERERVREGRGAVAVDEQRSLNLRRIQALRDEIRDLEQEQRLITGTAKRPATPGQAAPASADDAAGPPARLGASTSPELLRKRLAELRIKRNELQQRYNDDTPVMADIDREIADVERLMLGGIAVRLAARRGEAASLEGEVDRLNSAETRLDTLEREHQAAMQSFLVYSKRLEEARISEELDRKRVSNISVLTAPDRPILPSSPNRLLFFAISFPLGLVLGVVLALLLEALDRTIRSPRDLDALAGVTFLGALPVLDDGQPHV